MTHDLPQSGALIAGKYRIRARIGVGGMGAVYRAWHELMAREVAIKVLTPELAQDAGAKQRFIREAQAAARIRHANVVELYDVGEDNGLLYIVMELMHGQTLQQALQQGERSLERVLRLTVPAMQAVRCAHEHGVVHRDIKPDNIFIAVDPSNPTGITKVLDFGISKVLEEDLRKTGITQEGTTMGTPEYMSPEQFRGARDVDARTDVYAFGVVLYEALSRALPFKGDTFGAIAMEVAAATPPSLGQLRPDLPPMADFVVMKAMARDLERRYRSMAELLQGLAQLAADQGIVIPDLQLEQSAYPATAPVSGSAGSTQILDSPQTGSGSSPSSPSRDGAAAPTSPGSHQDGGLGEPARGSWLNGTAPSQSIGQSSSRGKLVAVAATVVVFVAAATAWWSVRDDSSAEANSSGVDGTEEAQPAASASAVEQEVRPDPSEVAPTPEPEAEVKHEAPSVPPSPLQPISAPVNDPAKDEEPKRVERSDTREERRARRARRLREQRSSREERKKPSSAESKASSDSAAKPVEAPAAQAPAPEKDAPSAPQVIHRSGDLGANEF